MHSGNIEMNAKRPESENTCDVTVRPAHTVALGRRDLTPAIIARFQAKFTTIPTARGCWMWQAGTYHHGYGQFMLARTRTAQRNTYAHRIAYVLAHGDIPEGAVVMHSCDVRGCVNPAHLSLGTQGDNVRDAAHKGRYSVAKPSLRRITDAQVVDILASTETLAVLAARYGVSVPCIHKIRNGSRRRKAA
jgi:hypothetical protein